MAEYVAGKGTTALGIIGTILGSLGVAGGSSILNGMGRTSYETSYATMHDLEDVKTIAEKDSEIAQLKAQQVVDAKIVDTYKELANKINALSSEQEKRWENQSVVNSQLTSAVNVNTSNLLALQNDFNNLTKVVIPSSNVCNTGCGCCNGNL